MKNYTSLTFLFSNGYHGNQMWTYSEHQEKIMVILSEFNHKYQSLSQCMIRSKQILLKYS